MRPNHPQAHRPELAPEGKSYKAPQKSGQVSHNQAASDLNKPAPSGPGPSGLVNGWEDDPAKVIPTKATTKK